jgi:signal peptidase I
MADAERVSATDPVPTAPDGGDSAIPDGANGQKVRRAWLETRETVSFLVKLAVFVLLLRTLVFSPFSIPSESMLPRLLIGDYLFISKWDYGYSRYSLPFSLPLGNGRIFARLPTRGDTVVFKAPPTGKDDWIKRVIGLPGDTIQVRDGTVILNGVAIPKQQVADFIVPVSPNYDCDQAARDVDAANQPICRYRQFRETLPGGRTYLVLDQGDNPYADHTGVYTVPAGHVFLMGDNRDDSMDSRFPALPNGGIGFVPLENLEGKARLGFWSTDGSAEWIKPWTWFSAARWSRIGEGF